MPGAPFPDALAPHVSPLTPSATAHLKRLIQAGTLASSHRLSATFCEAAGLQCSPDVPGWLEGDETEPVPAAAVVSAEGQQEAAGDEGASEWSLLRSVEEQVMPSGATAISVAAQLDDADGIFRDADDDDDKAAAEAAFTLLPAADYDDAYDDHFRPGDYAAAATDAPAATDGSGGTDAKLLLAPPAAPQGSSGRAPPAPPEMRQSFTLRELETGAVDFHLRHYALDDAPGRTSKLLPAALAPLLPAHDAGAVLRHLHVPAGTPMGRAAAATAAVCAAGPPSGAGVPRRRRACVASAEEVADFVGAAAGGSARVEVVTAPRPDADMVTELARRPVEVVATEERTPPGGGLWRAVVCRGRTFPFQVWECEELQAAPGGGGIRVVAVALEAAAESEADATGAAVAVCSVGATGWEAEREVGAAAAGKTEEMCQFLPAGAMLFLW